MNEFITALGPFVYGLVLGYFGYPLWQIIKKIWQEALNAKKEWKK